MRGNADRCVMTGEYIRTLGEPSMRGFSFFAIFDKLERRLFMKTNFWAFTFCFAFFVSTLYASDYKTDSNIPYRNQVGDEYIRERCVLDVYYPDGGEDSSAGNEARVKKNADGGFATLVWFHGGGLEGGGKFIPQSLKNKGICVVAVNYRLSPKAKHPAYIEDAAAAVAWVVHNIAKYGGDPAKVYVSGHSAGGYLASMVGLDKEYLAPYGVDPDTLAGFLPISGQTVTHYTVRKEMGLPMDIPYIDKYAPLSHIRKDTAPFVIIVGQAELDMKCRTAENFYLYEALKSVGNKRVKYHELSGFDHNTVCDAGLLLVLREIGAK